MKNIEYVAQIQDESKCGTWQLKLNKLILKSRSHVQQRRRYPRIEPTSLSTLYLHQPVECFCQPVECFRQPVEWFRQPVEWFRQPVECFRQPSEQSYRSGAVLSPSAQNNTINQ